MSAYMKYNNRQSKNNPAKKKKKKGEKKCEGGVLNSVGGTSWYVPGTTSGLVLYGCESERKVKFDLIEIDFGEKPITRTSKINRLA